MVTEIPGSSPAEQAWAEREQEHARAYDTIGARYDEAFPHKDGQLAVVAMMLERIAGTGAGAGTVTGAVTGTGAGAGTVTGAVTGTGTGARVLDVGSGTGVPTARQLVAAGCRVTCLDISPGMLEIARANVPEAEFVHGDVMELSTLSGGFEAVTAFFSLLHLPREKARTALGLIREALVPGGWFAVGMVEADVDDVPIAFLDSRVRVSGFLRDDLRAVLAESGFGVVHEQVLSYAPETSSAQPEIQMFFLCRKADEGS